MPRLVVLVCVVAMLAAGAGAGAGAGRADAADAGGDAGGVDVEQTILAAGSTEDEQERHRLLADLADALPDGHPLQADLEQLLPVLDRWANGRERYWEPGDQEVGEDGYLAGFFNFRAVPRDPGDEIGYPPEIASESPLYPIWAMYRGRMLIQQSIQTGFIARDPEVRGRWQGQGRSFLEVASEAFPDNRVLRMWLDEPIPWPAEHPPDPDAPAWANLQREALEKLTDVVDFWIDERQAPDGQLGGGWGDDVEIWRRWTPILLGFEYEKLDDAMRLLAEGLWELPRLEGGYTSLMSDVEHTSEDSGDTATAMLHVDPDDPVWAGRAERLAELMAQQWTGRNDRDALAFRSVYFTSEEVSPDPAFACDTPYHSRAVQPTLLRWQRTRDPALTSLLTDWLDTWVDATARSERGKPAGVVPAAIHWPSGEAGGPEPDWWRPGCAIEIDQGLYDWPSQVSAKLRTLILAFWITDDDRYLEPLRSMAELRRAHLDDPEPDAPEGSAAWAGAEMGDSVTQPLAKYRLLTGDDGFDDLLLADADAYTRFRLTGDDTDLLAELEELVAAFRVNREAYTTEVRWSDRLFSFASEYANHHVDEPLPSPQPDLLYQMVTGDTGDALYLPLDAVRWQTEPRDLAVLVESHDPTSLRARAYHFGDTERDLGAELLVVEPGDYGWSLDCGGTEAGAGTFTAADAPPVVELTLPARVECTLVVGPDTGEPVDVERVDDATAAADAGDGDEASLVIGLVVLAVFLGAVGAAALRRRRSASRPGR